MMIKAQKCYIMDGTKEEYNVQVNPKTTMRDLLDIMNCGLPTFPDYYPHCHNHVLDDIDIPFIFTKDNQVLFNVRYEDALIMDFIRTHDINNKTIRVVTGFPQAGGPGTADLIEAWNLVYPYLHQLADMCTLGGLIWDVYNVIKQRFIKDKQPPEIFFDVISAKDIWDAGELAKRLKLKKSDAEVLLKTFGYAYDERGYFARTKESQNVKRIIDECMDSLLDD